MIEQTTYDRAEARVGWVHLGFGAFHRAHQAVYLDDYMQATGDLGWGIAAVNLQPSVAQAFAAAQTPDGYALKTTTPGGTRVVRLVRSHLEYHDWGAGLDVVARDAVKVISMTVTESGYYLRDDWSLDTDAPVIAAELAGGAPQSVYGFLAQALARRTQPVTILCCDNIRSNGQMLRRNLLDYLGHMNPDLAAWVDQNAAFPCAMVDRITPRATSDLAQEIAALDPRPLAPIHAEAFTQWVLERNFAGDFPDLTRVGVQFVADVDPYEEAKIRILNGGHLGLAFLGALAGYQTFDQAMADPRLRAHFDALEAEILQGLTLELPFDKRAYRDEIADRFCNVAIADQLERLVMDGWSKMPIYLRPTLAAVLEQGQIPTATFDSVASWVVFARRSNLAHAGAPQVATPYFEPYWDRMAPLIAPDGQGGIAATPALWGDLPDRYPEFAPSLTLAIEKMERTWPV